MKVIISGGGICGLTLAVAARKVGLVPIVIEKSANVYAQTFGGGIGLWPPSQLVYEQLGLLQKLKEVSGEMPNPSYLNQEGWKLAEPSPQFGSRYKVLCLQREALSKLLYEECQSLGIEVRTNLNIIDAISYEDHVDVQLSNKEKLQAKVLIGADGINSTVRSIIMKERRLVEIKPTHCGYAYFRAVLDLSKTQGYSSDGRWHNFAFESWGLEKRFGYVPLKEPKVFWFFSVPLGRGLGPDRLEQYTGSHTCSQQQKNWIIKHLSHWRGPVPIKKLIEETPANSILRTDIRKIKGVTSFPWNSKHNNILIVGDAANATAPNLAQGAGLAIESAWDLISMVDFQTGNGVGPFLERRRKRATTVQNMADMVAFFGQVHRRPGTYRDLFMAGATKIFPKIEQNIFELAVRHSLGGSSSTLHWLPAINKSQALYSKYNGNVLKQVVGVDEFEKLPQVTKNFRSSFLGRGSGVVSVKSGLLSKLFGLPAAMQSKPFQAFVDVIADNKTFQAAQKWTRIFCYGTKQSVKYATIHHATPNFTTTSPTGLTLIESIGDKDIRKLISFGYNISLSNNVANYKSNSLWLWNYKLPIPSFFLPRSEWIEQQTSKGWNFDGKISFPSILGGSKFFQYKGSFTPQKNEEVKGKTVVITGGTGLIGKSIARQFHSKGWFVIILSRKSDNVPSLPFARIVKWNPSAPTDEKQIKRLSNLFSDVDVIINLAGQNPGAKRWDDQTKDKILQSRLSSIKLIGKSIQESKNSKVTVIQASAAGIYGHRGSQVLTEESEIGNLDTFRVSTCIYQEQLTREMNKKAINARIGHVFGESEGIFPFIRLSSQLRTKKFGKGGQYVPWIHVDDVAESFYFMAINPQKFEGKSINVASPEHHTYDSIYKTMGELKNRGCYFSIPQKILTLSLGELSCVLLQSQRMHPQRLLENGFQFRYGKLRDALLSKELL